MHGLDLVRVNCLLLQLTDLIAISARQVCPLSKYFILSLAML